MKKIKEETRLYITPKQAAAMYGFSFGYLANLRSKRQGPAFYKRGRKILYKVSDFEAWITVNRIKTIESASGIDNGVHRE